MTVDEPIIEKDVKKIVESTVKNEKFSTLSIEIEHGSSIGDGFVGVNSAVTAILDGVDRRYFIKMAPRFSKLREVMLTRRLFEREIYFNDKVVPALDEIYFKYTKDHLNITPICYFTSDEESKESLVFENLKWKGFDVNRKDYFDRDHFLLVLKAYSRLHAAGFILKKEKPNLFESINLKTPNIRPLFEDKFDMHQMVTHYLQLINDHCDATEDNVILDNMDSLKSLILKSINAKFDYGEYTTIVQQDSWRYNFMFKYGDSGIPEEVKLIDFQIFNVTSPVEDVLFSFYSSASSDENLEDLDFFLDYYYQNLKKEIHRMGGDVNLMYPHNIFQAHVKSYKVYGLTWGLCMLYNLFAKPSELPNVVQLLKENKAEKDLFTFPIADTEGYAKRTKSILHHLVNENLV